MGTDTDTDTGTDTGTGTGADAGAGAGPDMRAAFERARDRGPVYVVGCDPGPVSTALTCVLLGAGGGWDAGLAGAAYVGNGAFARMADPWDVFPPERRPPPGAAVFLAYERCGAQGMSVGEAVFETAAMGGEVRRAFRPSVAGVYAFRPSDWRYALCGRGNAKTPEIYAAFRLFFRGPGAGADPLKGTKADPGPLRLLHEAGAGGNMEHLKDALGVSLALAMVRYRSARDPEDFRRW